MIENALQDRHSTFTPSIDYIKRVDDSKRAKNITLNCNHKITVDMKTLLVITPKDIIKGDPAPSLHSCN